MLLMIVGMLLETLGVGMMIPAIMLMTGSGLQDKLALGRYTSGIFHYSQSSLIAAAVLLLLLVYLVKNAFLAYLTWRQTKFAFDVQSSLSFELFSNYLYQPYTFHLQRNSAQLVRNAVSEVSIFRGILSSSLQLISEFLALAGIAILLLAIEPVGVLVVSLFFLIMVWGFHRLTSDRLLRWGAARLYHDGLRVQHLQQGLGGIKEIKLLGREDSFLAHYDLHNQKSARAWKMQTLVQNLPRQLFELMGITGLTVLVLGMLVQGRDASSILPTLGVFAAAAFRLLPSVNRILASIQILRSGEAVINVLVAEREAYQRPAERRSAASEKIVFEEMELRNVTFRYPDQERVALDTISLSIKRGEAIGLIGRSGSGKSTLLDVILGLLVPVSGSAEINGRNLQQVVAGWQSLVGYVPQNIYLTDDTLRRNIAFGLPDEQIDEAAVQRAIQAAHLQEYVSQLPDGLDTLVGERGIRLSGGQRQRVGIARALYHDPQVLVLDEATSALDESTERSVMASVNALKGKKTILVVSHRMTTIESCDKLVRLELGKIVPPETSAALE